jgi:hypothetical protein
MQAIFIPTYRRIFHPFVELDIRNIKRFGLVVVILRSGSNPAPLAEKDRRISDDLCIFLQLNSLINRLSRKEKVIHESENTDPQYPTSIISTTTSQIY